MLLSREYLNCRLTLFFCAAKRYDAGMLTALALKLELRTILLLLALVAALVVSAVRISMMAPRYNRRRWVWFVISLFFTAIPATIVFWHDYYRSISGRETLPSLNRRLRKNRSSQPHAPTDRCPHCGEILTPDAVLQSDNAPEIDRTVIKKCPHCNMNLDKEHFA